MKKKIRDFLSKTGLGLFLVWGCAAAAFLAVVAAAPYLGKAQDVVSIAALCVLAAVSLWYAVAVVVTFTKRQWRKAAAMFAAGGAGACLFAVGFGFALAFNFWAGVETWEKGKEEPRLAGVPGEDGEAAFSVEYVNAHPFLAEYDKTIVFKSGKRIGVFMDTGGAGPFAVYRLASGEYCLVDGLEHGFIRSDYRVNVTNETVEVMCGETWIMIPDGTLAMTYRPGDSIGVQTNDGETSAGDGTPVGDSLERRRYLGLLYPRGIFEPGEGDPYAGIIESK